MSSEMQNSRSPEQQRETIESTIKRLGYPWIVDKIYIDKAISGRLVRRRPEFQRMLRDIRTGAVKPDAIVVDTFERFGRAEELASLRQELARDHGVLVLTADSQFTDPTSVAGRVLSTIESLRATEDTRVKAHCVLRGKRDMARQGHWPGGPAPFGLKLHSVLVERDGRQEVDHCILVPDPETAWIIQMLFRVAQERLWGSTRLARMLNEDPTIPDRFKPFYEQTIVSWLKSEIYIGVLVWEKYATGVVDDRRVIERNPEDEIIRVPNFCEPLVSRECWEAVEQIRRLRAERMNWARQARKASEGKQIAAVTPGLALRNILTGLVRCGHCNRAMRPCPIVGYITKAGEVKRYTYYFCPGYNARVCPNGTYMPEAWLRETVVDLIKKRLFPEME
jgi:DNA invertase Pin-like site-specific DNA recombinase